MKVKTKLVSLFFAAVLCLTGCQDTQPQQEKVNTPEESSLKIGLCFDSFIIERWQRDRDVFVSTAKELGADVNVQTANGEVDEQIAQIDYFIEKKMDAIVVIPIDAEKLRNVISKAKKEEIPVICYDRVVRRLQFLEK